MKNFISISESAAEQLQQMFNETNNKKLRLRLFVEGGGCGGLEFGFHLDEIINEDDTLIDDCAGFPIVADPVSIQYLKGATINYHQAQEGEEGRFSIRNPTIQTGCSGCSGHG